MSEKEFENKHKKYLEDERKYEEYVVDSRATLATVVVSVLHALSIFGYYHLFIFLVSLIANSDLESSSGGTLIVIFGMISIVAVLTYFVRYYVRTSEWDPWIWNIKSFFKDFFIKKAEKKKLKLEIEERREFFKLNEMLKDEDFRDQYLKSNRKSDDELKEKILLASKSKEDFKKLK